jgi:hypothetical protein
MPRNAVAPIWTVADTFPEEIARAIVSAFAIGMAYASVAETSWKPNPDDAAAVSMPTTSPWLLTSRPPESPGSIPAFVSISPVSCSAPPCSSEAVIVLPRPVTVPAAELMLPLPPALPRAVTLAPTVSFAELIETVFRLEAPCC